MQIRATVKWRQSLPLTRAAANHPPASSFPLPLPRARRPVYCWTPEGVSASHSPPALSLPPSSLASLALLIFTPRPLRRRRRHRHTKSRGWKYAPSRQFGVRLTRLRRVVPPDIYICASRFHWKILVPLEVPHGRRPTYEATHPPVAADVIVAWDASASPGIVAIVLGKRTSVFYISAPCHPRHQNAREDTLSFRFSPGKRSPGFEPVKSSKLRGANVRAGVALPHISERNLP